MRETVRELTYTGPIVPQRRVSNALAPTKTKAAPTTPATITPATGDDLQAAFQQLLAALAPAERQSVVAELHRPRRPRRMFEDTPEARAKARAMFGL